MPESDRGRHSTTLVWLIGGIAVLLFVGAVVHLSRLHGIQAERRAQAAHQHAERAKEAARNACLNADASRVIECVYETIEASEEAKRGEQDLRAQQDMALWTLGTMTLGFVAIAISGAGLIALIRTVNQGREALEHAKSMSIMELRPYLFVDKFDIEFDPYTEDHNNLIGFYSVTVWLKNFGSTPARNIRAMTHCYVTENLAELEPVNITQGFVEAGVAAPGHHRRTFDGFSLSEERARAFKYHEMFAVLRIIYLYTDDAGNPYEEAFDYFTDIQGLPQDIFYILSDRTRERARVAREQRSLFEEELVFEEEEFVFEEEEEVEPPPGPSKAPPRRKARRKRQSKRKPRPRQTAKPRPTPDATD